MRQKLNRLAAFLVSLMMAFSLAGCSQKATQADKDAVYAAWNQLCEATSLEAEGSYEFNGNKGDFQLWMDDSTDNGPQVAFLFGPGGSDPSAFYLKDLKTYLNFNGTKSQSLASNLGITKDTKLTAYNPLLDLDAQSRDHLFSSVTVDNGSYVFDLDKTGLQDLLDEYGSFQCEKAQITFRLEQDEISEINIDCKGTVDMGVSVGINVKADIQIIEINQPVTFPWPDDLDSYGK